MALTLNPKVLSVPQGQQPNISVAKPQSLPSLNVVKSTPTPQVKVQPLSFQPNLSVANKPANQPQLSSVGTIDNQKSFTPLEQGQLAPENRDKLNDVVHRMTLDGRQPEEIQTAVDQFKSKYGFGMQSQPEPQGERGLKGLGLGAVKGALNTVSNVGGLFNKVSSRIPDSLLATPFAPAVMAAKTVGAIGNKLAPYKENFKPQGTAEKVGYGAEQVGEFFIPGGAVSRVGKAAELGIGATKLPKLVQTGLKLGAIAGLEGGSAAGVTALQGGTPKDIKTAGITGGIFGVAAKSIEGILQKIPETAWTSILKRTPTEAAKNPKLPGQIAETGLAGVSRKAILQKSQQAIQQIEVTLDDLLSGSNQKIGTLKIAPYLDDLRTAYSNIPGEKWSVDTINNVMRDFLSKKSLTPLEANQLKRDIYGLISKSYGKGLLEIPAKTEAQKAIAAGLKREIEKIIPEAKSLNEKQAVYLQVRKALEKTLARTEGKGIAGTGIGLMDIGIGGAGTLVGLGTG